ncbi:MAG: hypothetical protein VX988_04585 [Planctomycetota bacterium]|nr:hypothetical protein [Planctomycetota bacterium]
MLAIVWGSGDRYCGSAIADGKHLRLADLNTPITGTIAGGTALDITRDRIRIGDSDKSVPNRPSDD